MKKTERISNLLPNGIPRYIRIYDNGGETFDRYTVVFTGKYRGIVPYRSRSESKYSGVTGGQFVHLGMSQNPYHPQGFGQHGFSDTQIDRPTYGHLGRKIKWEDLPADCQRCALATYLDIWGLD